MSLTNEVTVSNVPVSETSVTLQMDALSRRLGSRWSVESAGKVTGIPSAAREVRSIPR